MGTTFSSYYDLVRLRELGPEAKDWATTDKNFQVISLLLKAFEQHVHTGDVGLQGPSTQPVLTEGTVGGSLAAGVTVGVRLSYVNAVGLETNATTEKDITLSSAAARPLTPELVLTQPTANALSGGTYMYVMTKVKGTGETAASDALPVTIPYDQTYSISLGFDAISTYTDGTTQLNIYRSSGLNSSFQLVTEITDVSATGYTDTNVSIDQTAQPPSTSTFDSTKMITINWSSLVPHPASAVSLNVYITQQSGVWGTSSLLISVPLTGTPPTSYNYLGSETLNPGYPYDITQIPSQPGLIDSTQLAPGAGGGGSVTSTGAPPVGAIVPYTGSGDPPAPAGTGKWIIADGRLIDRTTYSLFFTNTGHNYNAGVDPGGNQVRVPDKRGKKSVGAINMGSGAGAGPNDNAHAQVSRGNVGGEVNHILSVAEMPLHNHVVLDPGHIHGVNYSVELYNNAVGTNVGPIASDASGATFKRAGDASVFSIQSQMTGLTLNNTGSGASHINMDPYEADSYLVRIL